MSYARNPQVLWRSTSHGPVVLLADRDPVRLGGVAAAVWEVLDEAMDRAAVQAEVSALTGASLDISEVLAELVDQGLVLPGR